MVPWMHKDISYGNEIVNHEYTCSNCGYVAMRYSHMIQDFRAGREFSAPDYKFCPNCGKEMEEAE